MTYPAEVAKVRLMIAGEPGQPQFKGPLDAMIKIKQNEGAKKLFAGCVEA